MEMKIMELTTGEVKLQEKAAEIFAKNLQTNT